MTSDDATFGRMARKFPVRTAVFSVGPPVLAMLQLINSYLHGVSILYASGFAVLMVAFAVFITRYHLVAFRLTMLRENRQNWQ